MKKKVVKTKKPPLMIGGKIKKDKYLAATMKKIREEQEALRKKQQEDCPHIMGSNPLSDCPDLFDRACIVWHRFQDGIIRGCCLNCQRVFTPEDKDYEYWRKHKTAQLLSEAVSTEGVKYRSGHFIDLNPASELESLSDEEIFKLFDEVVRKKKLQGYTWKMDTGKD